MPELATKRISSIPRPEKAPTPILVFHVRERRNFEVIAPYSETISRLDRALEGRVPSILERDAQANYSQSNWRTEDLVKEAKMLGEQLLEARENAKMDKHEGQRFWRNLFKFLQKLYSDKSAKSMKKLLRQSKDIGNMLQREMENDRRNTPEILGSSHKLFAILNVLKERNAPEREKLLSDRQPLAEGLLDTVYDESRMWP